MSVQNKLTRLQLSLFIVWKDSSETHYFSVEISYIQPILEKEKMM